MILSSALPKKIHIAFNYWGYDGRNLNDCEAVGIEFMQ